MTRPDRPKQFLDALGGLDGTQAISTRYKPLPVYPDASLGAVSQSSGARPVAPVRVRIQPAALVVPDLAQVVAQVAQPLPPRRPTAPQAQQQRRVAPLAPGAVPAAQYQRPLGPGAVPAAQYQRPLGPGAIPAAQYQRPVGPGAIPAAQYQRAVGTGAVPAQQYGVPLTPTRQQAASAGYYQGNAPTAVAPALATAHNQPMTYAPQHVAFQPGRSPANATSAPKYSAPQQPRPRKKAGWVQGLLALVIFALFATGLGSSLLDWLRELFER